VPAALFVTLREGFEAALVVSVMLAFLRQSGASGRSRSLWAGVGAAVAVSIVAGAVLFVTGGELKGSAEALFEGVVMLAAVAVLSFMIVWMQRQAQSQGARLRDEVERALRVGGSALFALSFLTVAREGLETALFLFAAARGTAPLATLGGAAAGLLLAVALGFAVYRGSRRLPLALFFSATNIVLVLFATYLTWRGVGELTELSGGSSADLAPPLVSVLYLAGMAVALAYLRAATRRYAAVRHAGGS
jgi:high-affinity iron transporter